MNSVRNKSKTEKLVIKTSDRKITERDLPPANLNRAL